MIVIGLTGTYGAGKGTIVEFLKSKGFKHFSVSEDYLVPEIKRRGLPVNRDSMILVANDLRNKHGSSFIVKELYKLAEASGSNSIIESIRTVGEVEELKKLPNFLLLAVDADRKVRYERALLRNSSKDHVSFEEFSKKEDLELSSDDPNKQNLSACISMADVVFNNNGSKEDLFSKVEAFLVSKNII